uniref:MYND-type domain-containing protein n=1 Tax=Periophthalmus magnuspinnatus TaxID=409849 RepID=A0A3B4AP31_9GOBI
MERDKQYCELCGKMENLLKCGRCRNSFYCSKEHQKQHWKEHKLKCKEADKAQQKQAEQAVRQAAEEKTRDGNGQNKKPPEPEQGDGDKDKESASLPTNPDVDGGEDKPNSTGTPNGQTSSSLKKLALEYIVPCMDKHGMCVVDNFLGVDTGQGILDNVKALHDTGKFTDGQLVSQKSDSTKDIRGDKITWIEGREPGCEKIRFLMSRMDDLIRHCNGKLGNYKINGRTK